MKKVDVLITKMLFMACHDLSLELAPWVVYVSPNAKPVLQGGPYPDENPDSIKIVGDLKLEQADEIASNLESLFKKLKICCETEQISD